MSVPPSKSPDAPTSAAKSVEEVRRRRRILAWVPTGIFVIVIAAVVAVTITTQNQGVGRPVPAPTADSRFTAKGLAYIERSRITRMNVSSVPISSESVGMKPNQSVTIENDQGLDEYLQLEGDKTFAKVTLKSFTITSRDGFVSEIAIPQTDTGGFTGLGTELKQASVYGLTDAQATKALSTAREGNIDGKATAQSFGPLTALKIPVTASVFSSGDGEYTVGYRIDLSGTNN